MPMHDYIEVDPDRMPYLQEVQLDDDTYLMRFNWNETARIYTVDLFDVDENPIYMGEPLLLNQPLWREINDPNLPVENIIPMDESGIETEVNPGNLNNTVFLCIDDMPDGAESENPLDDPDSEDNDTDDDGEVDDDTDDSNNDSDSSNDNTDNGDDSDDTDSN